LDPAGLHIVHLNPGVVCHLGWLSTSSADGQLCDKCSYPTRAIGCRSFGEAGLCPDPDDLDLRVCSAGDRCDEPPQRVHPQPSPAGFASDSRSARRLQATNRGRTTLPSSPPTRRDSAARCFRPPSVPENPNRCAARRHAFGW